MFVLKFICISHQKKRKNKCVAKNFEHRTENKMSYRIPHAFNIPDEHPHEGKVPIVTYTLIAVMVGIFLLYHGKALVAIPCGNDFVSILQSQFVHVNFVHIASNLFSLWYMANLERSMGLGKFLALVLVIAVLSSAADTLIGHVGGNRPCSIGFSGVLFGLVAWSVLTTGGFKWYNIAMVAGLLLTNMGPHISVRGHVIGAVTGLVLALLYKLVPKTKVY